MNTRTDTVSRIIHAAPAAIYDAFADAAAMAAWLPPRGMTARVAAFDFREGGGYRMRLTYEGADHPQGKSSDDSDEVEVRFVRLIEHRRIEQSVVFPSPDPQYSGAMQMTWTFEPAADGTEVTVTCSDVPGGISKSDHEAGISSSLANLAAFVEHGAAPA